MGGEPLGHHLRTACAVWILGQTLRNHCRSEANRPTRRDSKKALGGFLRTRGGGKKTLGLLSTNQGNTEAEFTLEADATGEGSWSEVKIFHLKPGESLEYIFPVWFQACWVRLISSTNTISTAQFTYE